MALVYWIKIDRYPKAAPAASDGLWRFSSGELEAGADPDGLYTPALFNWPVDVPMELSFLHGTVEMGSTSFELRYFAGMAPNPRGNFDAGILMRANHTNTVRALLVQDLEAGDTTAFFSDTGLAGDFLHIGREWIQAGVHVGAGEYTGCLRGLFGSRDVDHVVEAPPDGGPTGDNEAFDYLSAITDTIVTFGYTPDGGSYAAEVAIMAYTLQEVAQEGDGPTQILTLKCETLLNVFIQRPICRDLWRARITGASYLLDVNGEQGWVQGKGPMRAGQKPRPLAGVSGGDKRVLIQIDGGPLICFGLIPIETDADPYESMIQYFVGSDDVAGPHRVLPAQTPGEELADLEGSTAWEVFNPGRGAASDLGTLPLDLNPVQLASDIFTTAHGLEDLGVGFSGAFNLEGTWTALAAEFDGFSVGHLVIGKEGEPVDAWELVTQRLLRPLGLVPTIIAGSLELVRFTDAVPFGNTVELLEANWLAPPEVSRNLPAAMDEVSIRVADWVGDAGRIVRGVGAKQRDRTLFGRRTSLEIDATAFDAPPGLSQWIAFAFVERAHAGYPVLHGYTDGKAALYAGQIVPVTHSGAWSPDGAIGLEAVACLIISATFRTGSEDEDRTYEVTALVVGFPIDRPGFIAPTAIITDFLDPGVGLAKRIEVERDHFSAVGDPVNPDASGFAVAELVDFQDLNFTPLGAVYRDLEVIAIHFGEDASGAPDATKDVIEVEAAFAGLPIAGDHVVLSTYTSQAAATQALWSFGADEALSPPTVGGEEAFDWNH